MRKGASIMKEIFEEAEVELIVFQESDIITYSEGEITEGRD